MKTVVRTIHGSKLYGTDYTGSDEDRKEVFAMSLSQLITGADNCFREKLPNDTEFFSLKKFAQLLSQQQTNAIEMLFTPHNFILETSGTWEELYVHRHKLVSKNILPFVGYSKQQARLYSEKGNSLNMLKELREDFNVWCSGIVWTDNLEAKAVEYTESSRTKLNDIINKYPQLLLRGEKFSNNGKPIPYLQVLNKQFECFCPVTEWSDRFDEMINNYGDRAKAAAMDGAFDRKAMYHALRIIDEAVELLETGNLIFPRPESILLLLKAIRFDTTVTFDKASDMLMERYNYLMETALPKSTLQEQIDNEFLTNWYLHSQTLYIQKELKMN